MTLDDLCKPLVEGLSIGLIVASWPDLKVAFRNARVADWFPEFDKAAADGLCERIAGLEESGLRAALEDGEGFEAALQVKVGRRTYALAITATKVRFGDEDCVAIELHNNTKVHQLETMLNSYSKMVEQQNRSLRKEKERAEKLLLNIMPESVYRELKTFGVTTPQRYDDASILMLDFIGFTKLSMQYDPATIVTELNDMFTAFDRIAERQGCERIKTMGDGYVAVSGLPEPSSDHAASIARLALMCMRYLNRRNENHKIQWVARVGLAAGPVIGSVVGIQKYVYDIFGPGVNLASRLEALAGPMEILVSADMYQHLKAQFQFEDKSSMDIRGFGPQRVYALLGAEDLSLDIEPSMTAG
jgi:class 3 adenylate cyclase